MSECGWKWAVKREGERKRVKGMGYDWGSCEAGILEHRTLERFYIFKAISSCTMEREGEKAEDDGDGGTEEGKMMGKNERMRKVSKMIMRKKEG